MTHAPRIPDEPVSFDDQGAQAAKDAPTVDRFDLKTGTRSDQPADADVNSHARARFGDLKQNLTNHWKVQER